MILLVTLKSTGDCRANAELRRESVLELDLKGYSEKQIARKLHVSPQTINLDLKIVRKREFKAKEKLSLQTCGRSHDMWRLLLAELWEEYSSTENHQIRLRIISHIIQVMHEIDQFLPDTKQSSSKEVDLGIGVTCDNEPYTTKVLREARELAKTDPDNIREKLRPYVEESLRLELSTGEFEKLDPKDRENLLNGLMILRKLETDSEYRNSNNATESSPQSA